MDHGNRGISPLFWRQDRSTRVELHQRLVESQATYADLVKDVHEVCQFSITKIAPCTSRLDSLDHEMQNYRTRVAQVAVDLETLEKRVAVTECVLV